MWWRWAPWCQTRRWAPPWWRTASADLALAGRAAWYAGRAAAVGIAFPSVELSADSALVWSGAALEALPALGDTLPRLELAQSELGRAKFLAEVRLGLT